MKDDAQLMPRRKFLHNAAILGAGMVLGPEMLHRDPSQGRRPFISPANLKGNINFTSVNYNPPKVEGYIKLFEQTYRQDHVTYNVISSDTIHDKEVVMFASGGGQIPNLVYVGDESLRQFVDAGWIQPLDSFPGAKDDAANMFKHTRDSLTWKGKLYGLPYYSSVYVYGYNQKILTQAGINSAPQNLDDVRAMSQEIKKAKVLPYPLLHAFKTSDADGDFDWWSLLYASGGHMFDANLNPVFADSGSAAEQLLGWLVDALHTWKIMDPASLQTSVDDVYPVIGSAKTAFAPLMDLFLFYAQTGSTVKFPGTTHMTLFPGLHKASQGTVGWTRAYSIPTTANQLDATWPLLQFVGGKVMAGPYRGQYYAARSWFLTDALGYGYVPLSHDQQLTSAARKWVNVDLLSKQRSMAKVRENLQTPWYNTWTLYLQAQIQAALLRETSPRQAMLAVKKQTNTLKKQYGE